MSHHYCFMSSMFKQLVFLCWLVLCTNITQAQISGLIVDNHDHAHPMPNANVVLLPDSVFTTSDDKGRFLFSELEDGTYELSCTYMGFVETKIPIEVKRGKTPFVKLIMEPSAEMLETMVVVDEHYKQEETLQAEHLDELFMKENMEGTFSKTIEKLPGVSSINVGVGIAKPVIRGLSANRIIVNQQGIKQESQQWGSDHGLEIDQFDVERVEIIKGPASLQYGSDGLGGVINIMPAKLLPTNTWKGSLEGVYKSNNGHWGGSTKWGLNWNDVFLTARYSQQAFGDYRVPATSFDYNNYTLPIFENTLKNTAGKERNWSIETGLSRKWGVTRLLLGRYQLEAGLFSGAVGVPRAYALDHDGSYRDIDVPKQEVSHFRTSLNQTFLFGEDHLAIDVGFQRNLRQEFSYPEFHSIPASLIDRNNTLALELLLQTYTLNAHYEQHRSHDSKWVYGGNLQWQKNIRGGFEFLLPNFSTFRGGIFTISEQRVRENLLLNAGVRYDFGQNQTDYFRQFVWNSNEVVTDSLIAPATHDPFHNWSASIGANLSMGQEGQWVMKVNLGKSFRVPYPSETVSNGIHHGTFRHEMGTVDLKSEHGYQFDIGIAWELPKFSGSIAGYFNYFDEYIYLGPTFPARFSPLPEAGQIFQYRQDDAIYTGGELHWNWMINRFLEWEQAADFVQSYNVNTQLALPFTPQPSIKNDLKFRFKDGKYGEGMYIGVNHAYYMGANGPNRIDRSENETPAFQLLDISAGGTFLLRSQTLNWKLKVQNLLNTSYLNHLSRYRLINVPEQGRNVVISLQMPLGGHL